MQAVFESIVRVLTAGIAGSQVTPLRLLVVLVLLAALMWVTRRATRWFVEHVLAKRGVDVGLREALGTSCATDSSHLAPGDPASAGIDLTSLNVLVGAIGVGLGFGLQAVTSNFFSGLIILFERPIKIGQRIEIAGVVGQVQEIAARATTLVTDENVAVIVPNSQFISERVTNWQPAGHVRPTHSHSMSRTRPIRTSFDRSCFQPRRLMTTCTRTRPLKSSSWTWDWRACVSSCRCGVAPHLNTAGDAEKRSEFRGRRRLRAEGVPAAAVVAVTLPPSTK